MKRREVSLCLGSAFAAGAMAWSGAQAQSSSAGMGKKPESGTDFLALDKPAPVDAPAGKIEVIEFFWYSCPHCNAFEPTLDAWTRRLPKDVAFRRIPISFRDDFAPQQRLYFALEAMGLVDKLHAKVFQAIHAERQRLDQPEAIFEWVSKQGVDKAKFMDQFNSFSASSKLKRAIQLQNAYKVEGVPALGVAGRFYTDGTLTKNMERALQVVDFLVAEVRKGR
jgi:protein dithiol oxidoreductase (disulfide-forming)